MELTIIIVSFNTSDLLRKCLSKIYKALSFAKVEKISEVIVVDNASTDDSLSMVHDHFPKVILIKNRENLGFAKANNQAIERSSGKYALLLNSDTEVEKEALAILLSGIKADTKVGVAGGHLYNSDGTLQPSAGFFPNLAKVFFWMFFVDDIPFLNRIIKPYHAENKNFYEKKQTVDWVTGACLIFNREIIKKAGLFDENIFMYGEELEWCFRIRRSGYQVIFLPQAKIVHRKGASTTNSAAGIAEEFEAIKYFYHKHKPFWQLSSARIILRCGALLRVVIFGIIGKYPRRLSLYAKAFKLA